MEKKNGKRGPMYAKQVTGINNQNKQNLQTLRRSKMRKTTFEIKTWIYVLKGLTVPRQIQSDP